MGNILKNKLLGDNFSIGQLLLKLKTFIAQLVIIVFLKYHSNIGY